MFLLPFNFLSLPCLPFPCFFPSWLFQERLPTMLPLRQHKVSSTPDTLVIPREALLPEPWSLFFHSGKVQPSSACYLSTLASINIVSRCTWDTLPQGPSSQGTVCLVQQELQGSGVQGLMSLTAILRFRILLSSFSATVVLICKGIRLIPIVYWVSCSTQKSKEEWWRSKG